MAKRNLFAGKLIFLLLNFTQLNLHYSQTWFTKPYNGSKFYCILNLHYSQTSNLSGNRYTALQLR